MKRNNNKTIFAMFWSFFDMFSRQGISLIVQIILARILLPEHFGLIGMLYIFIALSQVLVNSGLDQALIREKKISNRDLSTVFYFNLIISFGIYTILFFMAPIISAFYNEPELVLIIRILMLGTIINAMTIVQRVIMIRSIKFKVQSIATIIATITSGLLAITMALNGFGVWSLVWQQLISQFLIMLILFIYNKWIPELIFDKHLFKYYYLFSYKLLIANMLDNIEQNSYQVIIGKLFPASQLGYYTNAKKFSDVLTHSLSNSVQRVAYPVLSNLQDDKKELTNKYVTLIRISAFIYFPIVIFSAGVSPIFIPLLLGEKWQDSVILFQLLSFGAMLYPINALNLNVLKVVGRSDLFLKLSIVRLAPLMIMFMIAFFINPTMISFIIIFICQSFISLLLNSIQTQKFIYYRALEQIRDLIRIMIPSLLMYFVVTSMPEIINANNSIMISIQFILGLFFYVITSLFINKWELIQVIIVINRIMKNDKKDEV